MGHVVVALDTFTNNEVIVKFCKENCTQEERNRFKREVRLLTKYNNSGYTIPILEHSLETPIPHFIMPKASGDLTSSRITDLPSNERMILRMIDCLEFIHNEGEFHRDVKPENFLFLNGLIVISDLGLAKDPSSDTVFTQSIHAGGTPVYAPPKFFEIGGFKNPTIQDDLFSLGKTIYFILSWKVPYYINQANIHPALFEVIKRLTSEGANTYSNCQDLKKDITSCFDIILNRLDFNQEYFQLKKNILTLTPNDLFKFFTLLDERSGEEKEKFYNDFSTILFNRVATSPQYSQICSFLIKIYEDIKLYISQKGGFWPFSYAEGVANDIQTIFNSRHISAEDKARGLKIAMDFSISMNRSDAEKTCGKMIESIDDDSTAFLCSKTIVGFGQNSILEYHVDLGLCKHPHIIKTILEIKKQPS